MVKPRQPSSAGQCGLRERVVESTCLTGSLPTRGAVDETAIRTHCKERGLSGYKIPRRVVTLTDMGRAPNGKADYKMLRSRAATELGINA